MERKRIGIVLFEDVEALDFRGAFLCPELNIMVNPLASEHGQCRCGQIEFEVKSKPLITMVCHCTGCQRMTASAYSLSALYASLCV
ncbi:MAG: hypothetical protein NVSMB10_05570 [Steroidobacteraceae bacterium]